MAITLFNENLIEDKIFLSEEESKHCIKVLRLKKGDTVNIINGKGAKANGLIADDNFKRCMIDIIERDYKSADNNYYIHVCLAPAKNNERNEWLIEKATEAGLNEITFLNTQNSVRNKINLERLNKIAVSAIKQCGRLWLLKINKITDFKNAVINANTYQTKLIAKVGTGKNLKNFVNEKTEKIIFFIGPEGDFTNEEMEFAIKNGFEPLSLGENVFRTETAALFVCMAAKTLIE
ncbi:MAG: RsmE family RNA methyltransferase [Bacteroidia bacterium]